MIEKRRDCGHSSDCWQCKHENVMIMYRENGAGCPYRIPPKIVNKTAIEEVRRKLENSGSWIEMIQR